MVAIGLVLLAGSNLYISTVQGNDWVRFQYSASYLLLRVAFHLPLSFLFEQVFIKKRLKMCLKIHFFRPLLTWLN